MSSTEPKFLLWWKLSAPGAFFLGQHPPSSFTSQCELPNMEPWPAGWALCEGGEGRALQRQVQAGAEEDGGLGPPGDTIPKVE